MLLYRVVNGRITGGYVDYMSIMVDYISIILHKIHTHSNGDGEGFVLYTTHGQYQDCQENRKQRQM